jgi:hypothetical protein
MASNDPIQWHGFYQQAWRDATAQRRWLYWRVAALVAKRTANFIARFVVCTVFGIPGIVAISLVAGGWLAPERTIAVLNSPAELQYAAWLMTAVGSSAGLIVALMMVPIAEPSIRAVIRRERNATAEQNAMRAWQAWVETELNRRPIREPRAAQPNQSSEAAS